MRNFETFKLVVLTKKDTISLPDGVLFKPVSTN